MKKRVIICLIIFIIWISLIFTDNIGWFDNAVYNCLYSLKSDTFTNIMKIITALSNPVTIIILTGLSLVGLIWQYKKSLFLVGTIGGSTLLNVILKNIFRRARPEHYRFIEETGFSFPSGHAMGSMSFYGFFIILVLNSKLSKTYKYIISIILGLIIFLIGISRIYLGVHYPSDIVGGYLISFIWLNIVYELMRKVGIYESTNNRRK